ncbi:MAG TPA: thioesterase family protein [Nocardioidaceae bacterium]|nr:thioesterase family protein [Nocardioidaceae bacterium]
MSGFSHVSRLVPGEEGVFHGDIHPEWTIGGKPNGGYLLAMLTRAALTVVPHEHVVAASAHFLHSPDPGPVEVTAEVLRVGRSASQVRTRLVQGGLPCIESIAMVGTLDPSAKPFWAGGMPTPSARAQAECYRLDTRGASGFTVAIMGQVDLRIDPDDLGFGVGQPRGLGELRGWLELPGEDFDPVSLLYAVDAFPPATFDVQLSGWVPTLELTAYVRALPAPGPVEILHKARLIDDNRVDESCYVWDSTGRLVAQSTQLAGIRL